MKENISRKIMRLSLIASLYTALSLSLSFISYGNIQFRIAEVLLLLCFFRKDYFISILIGTVLTNFFSPLGLIDIVFGTFASLLSVIGIMYSKKIWIAIIYPVIFNALIIGLELTYFYKTPFYLNGVFVGIGELLVMILGVFVFKSIIKSDYLKELIKANQNIK